jgi:alkylated DNA nucleotide flippase Atl1
VVHSGSSTAARLAEARLTALEEENAALRKEITRLTARIHECPRCNGRAIESGHPPREGNQEGARLDALEKKMDKLGPTIMKAIEERFGGRRPRSPEPRRKAGQPAAPRATQATMLPREQEGGEWRVVERRPRKKRSARKAEKKEETPAAPSTRLTGARKTGAAPATKKGTAQATKTAGLPRVPRTSAVTLTINKGVKTSYANVLATARQKVPLAEIGVESLGMR